MKNPLFPDIPAAEYDLRLAALQRDMAVRGFDAVVMFCEENQSYWSGYRRTYESPTVQWSTLVVPQSGQPTFVTVHGHYFLANKTSHVEDIRAFGGSAYWKLPTDPVALVLDVVREKVGAGGRIGLELGFGMHMRVTFNEFDRLRAGLQAYRLDDASDMYLRLRAIKTEWEIDLYRTLGDITAKGFLAGLMAVREGVTERDVLQAVMRSWVDQGAVDSPLRHQLMMRSGRDRYDMFTARPVDRVLRKGDQVFFDSGPCHKGYLTDIQRHASIGDPPQLCLDLFGQSRAGLEAAIDAIRPGVTASEIYQTACRAMEKVGVNTRVPWVFFGHSIGLTNHELPFIVPDDHTPLQAGMVLSIEVPAYDVPEFRVLGGFLEDVVLVTQNGAEVLTSKAPRDYWIVRE